MTAPWCELLREGAGAAVRVCECLSALCVWSRVCSSCLMYFTHLVKLNCFFLAGSTTSSWRNELGSKKEKGSG